MEWILPAIVAFICSGIFASGWILGGRNREKSIRIKGLEDVNSHYGKMAKDFRAIDDVIDSVSARLGVRDLSRRSAKIHSSARTGNRQGDQKGDGGGDK